MFKNRLFGTFMLLGAAIIMMTGLSSAYAQFKTLGAQPLEVDKAFSLSVERQPGEIMLRWTVADGYYLYEKQFSLSQGGKPVAIPSIIGNQQEKDDPTFGMSFVYENSARIVLPVSQLSSNVPLEIAYQGCQDGGICYMKTYQSLDLVSLALSSPTHMPPDNMQTVETADMAAGGELGDIALVSQEGGMVHKLLSNGGLPILLSSFLLFGLVLAFTPCVFPMYPILAATLARQGKDITAFRGFTLSMAYVLALAFAFGLLGVVAAWSGQNLQMALQSPIAIITVSVIFVILALSMFGLFEVQLPARWTSAVTSMQMGAKGSHLSAAAMGFTSALIVGPCVTAPLAGALLYIAQTGDVVIGASALFALGLGKGIPLVIFGTFGQSVLPKAGAWMNSFRQFFGFIFIATAIFMISRILPSEIQLFLWAALFIALAVWFGAFDSLKEDAGMGKRVEKTVGFMLGLYGVFLAIGGASGSQDMLRPLDKLVARESISGAPAKELQYTVVKDKPALEAAIKNAPDKPAILYVTADWCVTCASINRNILSRPDVQNSLQDINMIKVDVSKYLPEQQELMSSLQVVGPPTMIFLDRKRQEQADSRLIGDVDLTSFQAALKRLKAE